MRFEDITSDTLSPYNSANHNSANESMLVRGLSSFVSIFFSFFFFSDLLFN